MSLPSMKKKIDELDKQKKALKLAYHSTIIPGSAAAVARILHHDGHHLGLSQAAADNIGLGVLGAGAAGLGGLWYKHYKDKKK